MSIYAKSNWTNVSDFFILLNLSLEALVCMLAYMYGYDLNEPGVLFSGLVLFCLPAFGFLCFIIYQMCEKVIKCCWSQIKIHATNNIVNEDEEEQAPFL